MKTSRPGALALAAGLLAVLPAAGEEPRWSGVYVAAHGGYGFQPDDAGETIVFDKNLDGAFGDTVTTAAGANAFGPGFCGGAARTPTPGGGCDEDGDGADLGGRLGYDWQSGRLVIGVLAEVSSVDVADSVSAFSVTPARYAFTRELRWLGALRARVGVGAGPMLVYATGGAARAGLDNRFATSNAVNTFVPSDDDGAWGFQAGGGLEYGFARLRVGAEFLYTQLRDKDRYTVRVQGPAPPTNAFILTNPNGTDFRRSEDFEFSQVRLTVGYRF